MPLMVAIALISIQCILIALGNGVCDGSPYDSKGCRYDGGVCPIANVIKAKYPLCGKSAPSFSSNWALVENGVCDMVSMSNMVLRHSFFILNISYLLIN